MITKVFGKIYNFYSKKIEKLGTVDENENISEEHLVSEELNNFFKNRTKSLQINEDS